MYTQGDFDAESASLETIRRHLLSEIEFPVTNSWNNPAVYCRSNSLFPCLTENWGELPLQENDSEDMVLYGVLHEAVSIGRLPFICRTREKPQIARSSDRPKTLENGGGTVQLDSSNQQVMDADAMHTGNNAVSTTDKNNISIISSQQKSINNSLQRQHRRKSGIPITLEDIRQHFGMKLEDAAENLGVSRSTLKRACREYEITWWPSRKRIKDNNSLPNESAQCAAQEQIQNPTPRPISNPPRKKDRTTAPSTKPHLMAVEDATNVTIKAKYKDDFIKFQLPVPSGMAEFQQQVVKRLNLKVGTYSVKYKDDDNDWILLSCDEDLQDYISDSRSVGRSTVTMSLQPIATCPP